ncbi:MAG: hypothetical protein EAZ30_02905 [Betaproteobacteria bacterium]|nr:MAG: hypothetical protein EAZ30_02905 [Betaproteobacteria bacterium]
MMSRNQLTVASTALALFAFNTVLAQQTNADRANTPSVMFPVQPVAQQDITPPKDAPKTVASPLSERSGREQLFTVPRMGDAKTPPLAKGDGLTERPVTKANASSAAANREVDVLFPPGVANRKGGGQTATSTSTATTPSAVSERQQLTATPNRTAPSAALNALALSASPDNVSSHLLVAPGTTEIIPIAKNALNRIVTSFETAKARHSLGRDSGSSITAHGSVVYVGTYSEQPISAFIVDADDESRAISVVFVPRDIPPREIIVSYARALPGVANPGQATTHIGVPLTTQAGAQNPKDAQAWEEGQPYVDMLKTLMRTLALSELPPGYNLADVQSSQLPRCSSPFLRTTLGQIIEGSRFTVAVHRAENTSQQTAHFNESGCYFPGVVAVGAWPRALLNPGEDTEVFVIHRKDQPVSRQSGRPSLVQPLPVTSPTVKE